jgi:hypothetical protein
MATMPCRYTIKPSESMHEFLLFWGDGNMVWAINLGTRSIRLVALTVRKRLDAPR